MNPIEEINKALDELENTKVDNNNTFDNNGHCNSFMTDVSQGNFTFTINDGYCTYSYPLNIGSNNSVDDVAKKIYKAFNLKKENGTLKTSDKQQNGNDFIANVICRFNTSDKRMVKVVSGNDVFEGEITKMEWDVDQWTYFVNGEWYCQSEINGI